MELASSFRRISAPATARRVVQLTTGADFCYPLYYFIPSLTQDRRYLLYHRSNGTEVQIHRLDLHTGESIQLSHASAPGDQTHWRPYDMPAGKGVLDHRSALNVARNELLYFDGNRARLVNVLTGSEQHWFDLEEDRVATGQNCYTPDGNWFVYIAHDRESYADLFRGDFSLLRPLSRGTELRARHRDTDEERVLVRLNSPIHHVFPYDNERVLFCHPPAEDGMLITDLKGGWYSHLRTQDNKGGTICHFVTTQRGIAYELRRSPQNHTGDRWSAYAAGVWNPDNNSSTEFPLPPFFGYTHTGLDPSGKRWIFETQQRPAGAHEMHAMTRWSEQGNHEWVRLCADWPTFGSGQKSHFHPQVVPGNDYLLFVAGDARSQTNHIHLMDISDLPADAGVPIPR